MADGYNIVKLPVPPLTGKSLVPAKPNISALARQHGVSRQTIRRRLANGWQPPSGQQKQQQLNQLFVDMASEILRTPFGVDERAALLERAAIAFTRASKRVTHE
jgi:transposase-like protein